MSLLKKYSTLLKMCFVESFSFIAGKFLVLNLPILFYLSFRYLLMTIVGLCISLFSSEGRKTLVDSFRLSLKSEYKKGFYLNIFSGILYGLACILNYQALSTLPLSFYIVVENCFKTVIGILFGYFILKELINKKMLFFIFMVLIGTFLVLGIDFDSLTYNSDFYFGLLYLFLGSFIICLESILIKKISNDISSNFIILIKNIFTTFIITIFFLIFKDDSLLNSLSILLTLETITYFCLLFTIVGGFYVRYAIVQSIRAVGVYETNLFLNLSSVLGVLIAMFVFQEWFSIIQWLGFIIVCTFLYLNSIEKVKLDNKKE